MASDPYVSIGTCEDAYGDQLEISVIGSTVSVIFHAPGGDFIGMHLDADEREQFQRLFMEAERQAESGIVVGPSPETGDGPVP